MGMDAARTLPHNMLPVGVGFMRLCGFQERFSLCVMVSMRPSLNCQNGGLHQQEKCVGGATRGWGVGG